jgi:hypothetical protein
VASDELDEAPLIDDRFGDVVIRTGRKQQMFPIASHCVGRQQDDRKLLSSVD